MPDRTLIESIALMAEHEGICAAANAPKGGGRGWVWPSALPQARSRSGGAAQRSPRLAPHAFRKVRLLRATDAERALWAVVACRRLGFEVAREVPIARYTVDFYDAAAALAIEVDGPYHADRQAYDRRRDETLRVEHGVLTLRFSNALVLAEPDVVAAEIVRVHRARRAGSRGARRSLARVDSPYATVPA